MKLYDVIRKEELERFEKKGNIDIGNNKKVPTSSEHYHEKKSSTLKKIIIVSVVVAFVSIIYLTGIKFVHAKVIITPREIPFSANKIKVELIKNSGNDDKLASFQAMVVSGDVSREVFGGDLRTSTVKAKGRVVFFNDYSKTAVTIKAKTTLIGANGKKYTTDQTVTVAGYTVKKDGTKVTGTSPQVFITALDVGPAFNSTNMNLTVSGYTSAKSKLFYAQTASEITGGDSGTIYVVSDKEKPNVLATLNTQLIEKLKRETRTQIPDGYVAYSDLQFISIDNSTAVLLGTTIKFPASIKGSMVSYLIPRNLLEIAIANKVMSDHNYGGVTIPNILDLKVEPVTAIPTDPKLSPESITINITGNGKIITKIPTDNIKDSLLGIKKEDFSQKLSNIYEINTAKYNLYPFWSPFFPHDLNRINVTVE